MLRSLCFAALAAFAALPPPPARAEQVLKLAYTLTANSQYGAGATVFKRVVEKRSVGRYRIEPYPASALGDDAAIIKAVQAGQIDIAFLANGWFENLIPEFGIFDIPFLFRDANHARNVLDGPIGKEYLAMFTQKGMVALGFGEDGMRHLTNARHPIHQARDLAGLKLCISPYEAEMLGSETLGTKPAPLELPALYDALESGAFDGQESPIATIVGARLYTVQKYLTLSADAYGWAVFIMSKDAYDALSDDDKANFAVAAHIGGEKSRQYITEAEQTGLETLRQAGMEVVSDIDRDAFAAQLQPAAERFVQIFGAAQIERIRGTK